MTSFKNGDILDNVACRQSQQAAKQEIVSKTGRKTPKSKSARMEEISCLTRAGERGRIVFAVTADIKSKDSERLKRSLKTEQW